MNDSIREAHLQSVEPSSIQEDGETHKVAVFCYNLWENKQERSKFTSVLQGLCHQC